MKGSNTYVASPGVFWISWEDLCQYYDVIYLSWNPALFKESSCIHRCVCVCSSMYRCTVCVCAQCVCVCVVCSSWDGKQGPVKDVYSLANNPQFKLEVQCPTGGAAVWVLLTRHITDKVGTLCASVCVCVCVSLCLCVCV